MTGPTDWPSLPSTRIAVLMGGPSAEHDVSLVSGRAIASALAARGHEVTGWCIDLDGRWWELPPSALDASIDPVRFDAPAALGAAGPWTAAAALDRLVSGASDSAPVVFPALHGPFGEDGTVQALVAAAGLACCGSGVGASAIGMDKTLAKRIWASSGLPVLPWLEVTAQDWRVRQREVIAEIEAFAGELAEPRVVVKPARLGSSIGISIVHRADEPPELEEALALALGCDDLVLVEPALDHPRELEVAVLGNGRDALEVFGPGEIIPGREFYDFTAKYRSDASRSILGPSLEPGLADEIRRIAAASYLAIGAADFARVDFMLDADGTAWLSEINTIPGFTPISLFPQLCATAGHDFGATCERIVALALVRTADAPGRRLTRADLP